uniref:Uncharacterized protein n=1 Tax=Timema shepardi TaxID=629360 RepID=A0A7R9ANL3_TIMSH|nr:unnamed protein product [Timema shepardi]
MIVRSLWIMHLGAAPITSGRSGRDKEGEGLFLRTTSGGEKDRWALELEEKRKEGGAKHPRDNIREGEEKIGRFPKYLERKLKVGGQTVSCLMDSRVEVSCVSEDFANVILEHNPHVMSLPLPRMFSFRGRICEDSGWTLQHASLGLIKTVSVRRGRTKTVWGHLKGPVMPVLGLNVEALTLNGQRNTRSLISGGKSYKHSVTHLWCHQHRVFARECKLILHWCAPPTLDLVSLPPSVPTLDPVSLPPSVPHYRPGISTPKLPHSRFRVDWKPLQEDKALKTELESPKAPSNVRHHFGDVFAKSRGTKRDDSFDKDQLPIDIDREMEEISLIDIMYYEEFINKPWKNESDVQNSSLASVFPINEEMTITRDSPVPTLRILEANSYGIGPEQADVLQALTTSASNDIINLERVETLGDSFLKFAVSLFLFNTYGVMNEGVLTSLKGKLLSNRNLTYSAKKIGLGGIIKVHDFAPISDWIPPGMCVQRSLQTFFQRAELSPHFLYDIEIPENERQEGIISGPTLANIIDKLLEKVELEEIKKVSQSSMEGFLSLRTIADKCLADSANGIAGALNMVKYLQVLPDTVTPNNLLYSRPCTALLGQGDMELYLKGTKVLEYKLGYTFKDRSYLLQALTHPSFYRNRVTDCYQRYSAHTTSLVLTDSSQLTSDSSEKSPDQIMYPYAGPYDLQNHHCGLLSPGQITDLRSALVNNTTFAVLSVRYGFHQFILHSSSHLMDAVNRFVLMQEERCHEVNTDTNQAKLSVDTSKDFQAAQDQQSGHIRLAGRKFDMPGQQFDALYMLTETDPMLAEAIEVPKVLGDVFESIAGAIYLDSNKSLSTVWDIYYHLMKKEIDEFSKNVPLQPVRLLYELTHSSPSFLKTEVLEDLHNVMVTLEFMNRDKKNTVYGFGENKNLAKKAAARLAIKELTESSK